MPKFTFLLPAYKGRFLREMLESIQKQTYTDFKVIISDDCSPDNLEEICNPFLSDSRFLYRRNATNIGAKNLVSHWNLLLEMCDTDYCIFASDDDLYAGNYLEELEKLLTKFPDISVFRPRVQHIDENGSIIDSEPVFTQTITTAVFLEDWGCNRVFSGFPYYCFATRTLREMGGVVDFPFAWFSDDATVAIASLNNGMAISHDVLFSFRCSSISISGSITNANEIEDKIKSSILFYQSLRKLDLSELTSEVMQTVKNRIRGVVFSMVIGTSKLSFIKGLRMMMTCHQLFPYRWIARLMAARLGH